MGKRFSQLTEILYNQLVGDDLLAVSDISASLSKRLKLSSLMEYSRGAAAANDMLINGQMFALQRGVTSSALVGYQTLDRWRNDFLGGTITMSRQENTAFDSIGRCVPRFFMRYSVTGQSLATHYAIVSQRIESVRMFSGRRITVSGFVRRSAGAGNVAVELYQNFGTGGTPSADVLVTPQLISVSNVWQPFAVSFDVPSISSKTIGTNEDSFLGIQFWASGGSNFNSRSAGIGLQTGDFDFCGIEAREGEYPIGIAERYFAPSQSELYQQCLRYCQRFNITVWLGFPNGYPSWPYLAPFRATPSIFSSSVNYGSGVGYAFLGSGFYQSTVNSAQAQATLVLQAEL